MDMNISFDVSNTNHSCSDSNMELSMEDTSQSNPETGFTANEQSTSEQMPNSAGQPLIDFLQYMENYKPSVPDSITSHFMQSNGFETNDPRILRLISIASQKFIADIANDSLQHCKMRTALNQNKKPTKDKRYSFTFEDLNPVLTEYGINIKKPQYFF